MCCLFSGPAPAGHFVYDCLCSGFSFLPRPTACCPILGAQVRLLTAFFGWRGQFLSFSAGCFLSVLSSPCFLAMSFSFFFLGGGWGSPSGSVGVLFSKAEWLDASSLPLVTVVHAPLADFFFYILLSFPYLILV